MLVESCSNCQPVILFLRLLSGSRFQESPKVQSNYTLDNNQSILSYISCLSFSTLILANGRRQPSSTKSILRLSFLLNEVIILDMVISDMESESLYSTSMSMSLSALSSPLEQEPNSHAFFIGWVAKYCLIVFNVLISMNNYVSVLQRYNFSLKQMSKCLDNVCIYNDLTFLATFPLQSRL